MAKTADMILATPLVRRDELVEQGPYPVKVIENVNKYAQQVSQVFLAMRSNLASDMLFLS